MAEDSKITDYRAAPPLCDNNLHCLNYNNIFCKFATYITTTTPKASLHPDQKELNLSVANICKTPKRVNAPGIPRRELRVSVLTHGQMRYGHL